MAAKLRTLNDQRLQVTVKVKLFYHHTFNLITQSNDEHI